MRKRLGTKIVTLCHCIHIIGLAVCRESHCSETIKNQVLWRRFTSDGLRASERKKDSNRDWHFREKNLKQFRSDFRICFGAKKSSVTTLRAPRLGGDTFWGEPMRRWRRWWRWRRLWRRLSMSSIICLRKISYGSQRSMPWIALLTPVQRLVEFTLDWKRLGHHTTSAKRPTPKKTNWEPSALGGSASTGLTWIV